MDTFVYTLHFLVCFVLIGVVLLQRGKGADLGASLGGGGANTIFGSRGAGNFLTKITTASAIIFMCTSLSLAYLGYERSDVQLFDSDTPIDVPGGANDFPSAVEESGGLEEIPADYEDPFEAPEYRPADPSGDAAEQPASVVTPPPAGNDTGESAPAPAPGGNNP